MAASIVSPSLTLVFPKSRLVSFQMSENWQDGLLFSKRAKGMTPTIIDQYPSVPTVAKIFENCVCDQLSEYLNANNLPSHCQSGFRSLHSTLTALVDAGRLILTMALSTV